MLTTDEIQYLAQRIEMYVDIGEFENALSCCNTLIDDPISHPHYLKKRAFVHRVMGNIDVAIEDLNKAIELDPDDAYTYCERGACSSHQLSLDDNIELGERNRLMQNVIANYKASVERDPTCSNAWLALIETHLVLHNWDEAISYYGTCRSYIDTDSCRLVRSWLGCLALTFAGDTLEEEDPKPLNDSSIRLSRTDWCLSEIDGLLIELGRREFSSSINSEKLQKAKELHQQFVDHFDVPPLLRFK